MEASMADPTTPSAEPSSPPSAGGHLAFYTRHGISPVRYASADLGEHFQRRDALYRALGLPPVAFKGARVLEVAPGSGQNSLYIACRHPAAYELVEPNPTGLGDIEAAYAALDAPHTAPTLRPVLFEDYEAAAPFDIVLCENWLGSLPNELYLIRKLAGLVASGGVLVVTAVPLAGFFPNVMRKLLALRLTEAGADFETTTARLLAAFSPHLSTIAGMTRSHRDWVHDCLINPHYLHVALPFDTLLSTVGADMAVLASCPRFTTDWRWFKAMTGDARDYNGRFLAAAAANIPSFLDYRREFPALAEEAAGPLSALFATGYQQALAWQAAHLAEAREDREAARVGLGETLESLGQALAFLDPGYRSAYEELRALWDETEITPEAVAGLRRFGGLFGRETVYVSLTRALT